MVSNSFVHYVVKKFLIILLAILTNSSMMISSNVLSTFPSKNITMPTFAFSFFLPTSIINLLLLLFQEKSKSSYYVAASIAINNLAMNRLHYITDYPTDPHEDANIYFDDEYFVENITKDNINLCLAIILSSGPCTDSNVALSLLPSPVSSFIPVLSSMPSPVPSATETTSPVPKFVPRPVPSPVEYPVSTLMPSNNPTEGLEISDKLFLRFPENS